MSTSIIPTFAATPLVYLPGPSTGAIIAFALIFLVLIVVVVMSYTTVESYTKNGVPGTTVRFKCAPGQCVTNVSTGEKTCPKDPSTVLTTDPVYEVCNSRFTCENNRTPYAVQSDGSTNSQGLCESGVECRCLPDPQCADYIVSTFSALGGNPYLPLDDQRIVFTQSTSYVATDLDGGNAVIVSEPPLRLENASTQFCTVPSSWRSRLVPRKCTKGVLAYIPEDPLKFNYDSTRMGCVPRGVECPEGDVPVWDKRVGFQTCAYDGGTTAVYWTCDGFVGGKFKGFKKLINPKVMVVWIYPVVEKMRFRYPDPDIVSSYYSAVKLIKTDLPARFRAETGKKRFIGTLFSDILHYPNGTKPDNYARWDLNVLDTGHIECTPVNNYYTPPQIGAMTVKFRPAMLVFHST